MVETVDTEDLKSSGRQLPCGFESRPRHWSSSHRWSSSGFARFRVSGRALSAFIRAQRCRGLFTRQLEARAQIPRMRERSGRQDVPERSIPSGLARRASGAHATT